MRTFLICAALFYFLHTSWAPTWGHHVANWAGIVYVLSLVGGATSKMKIPYQRNRYYDNDYYDQQHP